MISSGSVACAVHADLTSVIVHPFLHCTESTMTCSYLQPSASVHCCAEGQQRPAATVPMSSLNFDFAPTKGTTSSKCIAVLH